MPPDEARRLAAKLGMTTEEFLAEYAQFTPAGYLLRRTEQGCVFLSWEAVGQATCVIHPFRPAACREWTASLDKPECREGLALLQDREAGLA